MRALLWVGSNEHRDGLCVDTPVQLPSLIAQAFKVVAWRLKPLNNVERLSHPIRFGIELNMDRCGAKHVNHLFMTHLMNME